MVDFILLGVFFGGNFLTPGNLFKNLMWFHPNFSTLLKIILPFDQFVQILIFGLQIFPRYQNINKRLETQISSFLDLNFGIGLNLLLKP